MIVHLNGWPGVGKLTVGRKLAPMLNARLLDNHTLHNVALAICDLNSPERWSVYYAVRDVAYRRVREMPASETIVMTNALTREAPREAEAWKAIRQLAAARNAPLVAVTLDCPLEENCRRVRSRERLGNRKLVEPASLVEWRSSGAFTLIDDGADHSLTIQNGQLSAVEAADQIRDFVQRLPKRVPARDGRRT
jgi:gluconate kinase